MGFIHRSRPGADCSTLSVRASDGLMEAWERSLVLLSVFASHAQRDRLLLCGEEDLLRIGLLDSHIKNVVQRFLCSPAFLV